GTRRRSAARPCAQTRAGSVRARATPTRARVRRIRASFLQGQGRGRRTNGQQVESFGRRKTCGGTTVVAESGRAPKRCAGARRSASCLPRHQVGWLAARRTGITSHGRPPLARKIPRLVVSPGGVTSISPVAAPGGPVCSETWVPRVSNEGRTGRRGA